MRFALVVLLFLIFPAQVTQAFECLEPSTRVISRWKNGNYYKGEIDSITNRVNVLFDNGARQAYSPRDDVDIVVDRIPDHNELPWGSQILVNRPRSRAFVIGYIRDIKNGRFVILYENGDEILHTLDQLRAFNKSRICDEPAYLGCFRDNLPRDLQVYIPTRPATIGACVDTCKSQGFSIGALRNSDLCFCGNSYSKANQVEEKECNMPCYDNSYELCGGFMAFSQYWTGIVDSTTQAQPQPGLQKHFIPSNRAIPWELLMHARAKYPSRYGTTGGSARSVAWYKAHLWNKKGKMAALLQQKQANRLKPQSYPTIYRGKALYAPGTYQRYYGSTPYRVNTNGLQLLPTTPRYNYQATTYAVPYRRPIWPYNYKYNNYKYRNYNFQNNALTRPYNGYQSFDQRRLSPQENAKLMSVLQKVSKHLFSHITRAPVDLSSPRFMGCFQDSAARDLPTEIDVRPLTVEGCVFKCGQSGFSMAGLQSSSLCFCGTTYSRYGRLRDEHCTMRCTGNFKEICGGFMRNSIYYTGVGQAIPYFTKFGPRTQKITFVENNLPSSHENVKPEKNPKASKPNKASPQKTMVKTFNTKDKTLKKKAKQPTKSKEEQKRRPISIEDYGKLRQILQTLSRWQQQAPELRNSDNELKKKPLPSYQELRKVLKELTPEIVKDVATKIMAGEMNRTRLRDMKPLKAVHSLEVNMAASKVAKEKETGFKRVKVNNYKNWSQNTRKGKNQHGDIILEEDAKALSSTKNSPMTKETPLLNANFANGSRVSPSNSTQSLAKTQTLNGTKAGSLLSIAEKGGPGWKKASKKSKAPPKGIPLSEDQLNKLNFVHFVVSETKNNKKMKIPESKVKPSGNQREFNEAESSGEDYDFQVNNTSHVQKNGTKTNGTSTVSSSAKSSGPVQEVEEVFETFDTPSNRTRVKTLETNAKKSVGKGSKKVPADKISVKHKNKVLHVEAKWNGQINVKANWKDVDETELETKPKKTSFLKKTKEKPTKTNTKLHSQRSEEEEGEEYNFDDSGSRNDLIWRNRRSRMKDKSPLER
ncbi:uncharacterized protein [Montipora foliosa]|uniref:uncharacterized protein n=1 Tax=Montipora foliosa TaxID=591990 RepID=UPI0035F11F76